MGDLSLVYTKDPYWYNYIDWGVNPQPGATWLYRPNPLPLLCRQCYVGGRATTSQGSGLTNLTEVMGLFQEWVGEFLWPAMCRRSDQMIMMVPSGIKVCETMKAEDTASHDTLGVEG